MFFAGCVTGVIFTHGNGEQWKWRDSPYCTAVRQLCEILNRAHCGASEEVETLLFYVKCMTEAEANKVVEQENIQMSEGYRKTVQIHPTTGRH